MYNPSDWYWSGHPGGSSSTVVYSSSRGVVSSSDTTYLAWLALGNSPSAWPPDTTGVVSAAALDSILANYGLPPTGLVSMTDAQLFSYAWKKAGIVLSASRNYVVSGVGTVNCDCNASAQNVQAFNTWGFINQSVSPSPTQRWTDNLYNVFTFTPALAIVFTQQVLSYGQSVYNVLADVAGLIRDDTVTTYAQIDAQDWPV